MDINARVDVNCGQKDRRADRQTDGCLHHTLLKQVPQKPTGAELGISCVPSEAQTKGVRDLMLKSAFLFTSPQRPIFSPVQFEIDYSFYFLSVYIGTKLHIIIL